MREGRHVPPSETTWPLHRLNVIVGSEVAIEYNCDDRYLRPTAVRLQM